MPEAAQYDELRIRGGYQGEQKHVPSYETAVRLMAAGMTVTQIAKELHRGPETIKRWMMDDGFRAKLKELNGTMFAKVDAEISQMASTTVKRITSASDAALDKILELMETAGSEQVQLKAAQDILDRNPDTSKTHKVQSTETKVTIDATFLQLAATAEKEITIDR